MQLHLYKKVDKRPLGTPAVRIHKPPTNMLISWHHKTFLCASCVMARTRTAHSQTTHHAALVSDASSFLISASPSIFLSCVASSRSPRFAFSLSSSMALSYTQSRRRMHKKNIPRHTHLLIQIANLLCDGIELISSTWYQRRSHGPVPADVRSTARQYVH